MRNYIYERATGKKNQTGSLETDVISDKNRDRKIKLDNKARDVGRSLVIHDLTDLGNNSGLQFKSKGKA